MARVDPHSHADAGESDTEERRLLHAEALMARNRTTAVVRADLRDVDEVLSSSGELLGCSSTLPGAERWTSTPGS